MLVVGGGPAGLSAATELRRGGVEHVVVVDREPELGGIPRHSEHQGYGLTDLHRLLSGPTYARSLVQAAERAGADLRPVTSVTDWSGPRRVQTTSPGGLGEVEAAAIVLATGCRERPRSPRLIAGSRPAGILTTGSLQQFVHVHRLPVGEQAIVIGAEHVSFSAVMTLRRAGVRVAAMVTEHERHQSYPPLRLLAAGIRRVRIYCGARVTRIFGLERVEGVEISPIAGGASATVDCDTIVCTGDWVTENELARSRGLTIDGGTTGPQVDERFRTSEEGIFAVGNLLHGAETADVAAREGRRAAAAVQRWLASGEWPSAARIPLLPVDPFDWIVPNAVQANHARRPRDNAFATLRVSRFVERGLIEVRQGERVLWSGRPKLRTGRLVPNRSIRIPTSWIDAVAGESPITVRVRS